MHSTIGPDRPVAYAVFTIAIMAGFVCWIVSATNMLRAVAHRKPGVPLWSRSESPFRVLWEPALLTDRGLSARKWCFLGLAGFLVCLIAAVVSGG
jgi:hypothetical protein